MIDFRPLSSRDAPRAAALIRAAFSAQDAVTTPPSSALKESAGIVERKLLEGGGAAAFAGDELIGLLLWASDGDALSSAGSPSSQNAAAKVLALAW